MISDFVKGKKKFDYPHVVQTGISLHRAIDDFTDRHPATIGAKQFFKPAYRLYSSVFMDIVYDYYLANDKSIFKEKNSLSLFASDIYRHLSDHEELLPDNFRSIFPYMKAQDWLSNYQYHSGIRNSFRGLTRRATYICESETAFSIFENRHDELQQYYLDFFPSVRDFAFYHLQLLQKN
jgi:acyl carrier protein phosphodiesterase